MSEDDEEIKHCPQCHKNVKPVTWLCGCVVCPECSYCFRPCIPPVELQAVEKGICPECGNPIVEYVEKREKYD